LSTACGFAAALALLILSTLRSGNRSPGGVDNAGSVAIVLELARHLPSILRDDVDLIFLSPGAEEDHMVGVMRWLDEHSGDLGRRPVYALNFDGAGIPGRIALLERFGFGRRFSARLSQVARTAAKRLGIPVRGVFLPPAMGVDAIPFAHRGIDCLTIASGSLGRATFAVHSAGDVADNLDGRALDEAARLGLEMAKILSSADL
ncbi:MAG: M28 family metallopeptidase, partial [Acidobacteriota bacterium]|nr:M28 family metallopeptidase [Acidobacteriota bacterium]